MSKYIDIQSLDYPCLLKDIGDPPKRLYYKGNFRSDIFDNCLAVVGSRVISSEGSSLIKLIFSSLEKSVTIVSGFMTGVDAESHEQALRLGLKTIAVMPYGIEYIHPEKHVNLYNRILCNDGLILSEYDGNVRPEVWTYPRRNRIVAGISKATLVIEASLNSGSLITASLANDFGREVFVFTQSNRLSEGVLLISNQFAKSIVSGSQINKYLKDFNKEYSKIQILNKHQLKIF